MEKLDLSGKKILFILPPRNFRDEEYQKPRAIFENAGARVIVASSALAPAEGMLGTCVTPDISIKEVKAEDVDAILLVGGVSSNKYWHNEAVHGLVREANQKGKVVSAICLAPVTLANAGLLAGKRATAYPSAESFLKWKGAIYTGSSLEVEENIVTANGPEAAKEFAVAVAGMMAVTDRDEENKTWTGRFHAIFFSTHCAKPMQSIQSCGAAGYFGKESALSPAEVGNEVI